MTKLNKDHLINQAKRHKGFAQGKLKATREEQQAADAFLGAKEPLPSANDRIRGAAKE